MLACRGCKRCWRGVRRVVGLLALAGLALAIGACQPVDAGHGPRLLPPPAVDAPLTAGADERVAVFAGGCFWGIEAVFARVAGVDQATAGYSGGAAATAHYGMVSSGMTGHAESVRVAYNPAKVSYGTLLRVFFSVALDPTQRNRQGPDVGSQYRSVIFYATPEQRRIATAYIAQLTAAGAFAEPIVTRVQPLAAFYPAEAYHQDYYEKHPDSPYIVRNDRPKVLHLQQFFPRLYREERQFVAISLD